jgi:tetratricopeptide (TPR) repeat protein
MRRQSAIVLRNIGPLFILTALAFVLFFLPAVAHARQDGSDKVASLLKETDTLLEEGSVDKAIVTLKKANAEDPENPEPYDRLGYILLQKGRTDDAIAAFSSALRIRPTLRAAKTGIGLSLLKKGDLKAAEDELTAALSLNPDPSMTHYALGLVYDKMSDYEKAIAQFKAGIKTFKGDMK